MERRVLAISCALMLAGCAREAAPPQSAEAQTQPQTQASAASNDYIGTTEPFAAHAVYFVLTDRFVNGDPANDQRDQGGSNRSFDRPVAGAPKGRSDNVGYLGGDFRGLLDNADYIRGMGFGAVWVTPIVDNPDEAFTGGDAVKWGGMFTDRGKTGYHGYWGVNFYKLDEHLPSADLDFAGLTAGLKQHGLRTVLDIVANHGSPAYTMPKDQPKFGEIYDKDGTLIADHQNLPPPQLDPQHNPLHAFYNTRPGLAQLSDINENDPRVWSTSSARTRNGSIRAPMRSASIPFRGCRIRSGIGSQRASARSIRASSCSAKPSTTTRRRSPRTRCRATPA